MRTFVLFFVLSGLSFTLSAQKKASVTVHANQPEHQISKHIYGHFAEHLGRCIYDGIWVSPDMQVEKQGRIRMDIVKALKEINIPNLRWPGGCFADEYQWRDGIGKPKERPVMLNSHWGRVPEDNSFGTHEFLELCELLECEPYISANMGSGTPEQMRDWIEYLNYDGETSLTKERVANGRKEPFGVTFWGVGNESWGCGGRMTADFYANMYRWYQEYVRSYSGYQMKKIACGPNAADYNWTEVCMKNIPKGTRYIWGLSAHYYVGPRNKDGKRGDATGFDEYEYYYAMKRTADMEDVLKKHIAIMDRYDPEQQVALVVDEWGVWANPEPGTNPAFLYQQNSMRDAMVAASALNTFNNLSYRIRMANLAQTINVLQALVLTEKEKMLLTPTYYIFKMYKVHQDAHYLASSVEAPDYVCDGEKLAGLNVSASVDKDGVVHISLVNLDTKSPLETNINLNGYRPETVDGEILTSHSYADYNSFEQPNRIETARFKDFRQNGDQVVVKLPPLSVVVLSLK